MISERGEGRTPPWRHGKLGAMTIIDSVKGAPDILPPVSAGFNAIESAMLQTAITFGYERIRTPVFEHTEVYARGVGASTDIVNKEMYTFEDKGGRSLTLRPEGTAGIVRAALSAGIPRGGVLPWKVSWVGEVFRYERPQSGRQRSFTQMDVEALGTTDPAIDAELIILGWDALRAAAATAGKTFDATNLEVRLNTLGDRADRPAYHAALNAYLDPFEAAGKLPKDVIERRHLNPLRAFDSKAEGMAEIMAGAPLLKDHISEEAREHHRQVVALLDAEGIPIIHDAKLVRGLDYYTRTTFEYQATNLGAQSAVGGGGRFDGLAEDLGWNEPFQGIGLALGVDRTYLSVYGVAPGEPNPAIARMPRVDVFGIPMGAEFAPAVFSLITALRREGIRAEMGESTRKPRALFKSADRAGATYALIIGEEEANAATVTVKDLGTGNQYTCGATAAELVSLLSANR